MRAFHLDRLHSLDGLVLHEHDIPSPGPNEVLVRVHAASLNYRDLMVMAGTYPIPAPPGTIALSDGAGEVIATGDNVTRVARGDRVAGTYFLKWFDGHATRELVKQQLGSSHHGMLAEYRVLPEDSLVKVPAHLSYLEAACLPCAAVTAWSAVTGPQPILAGETVLVLGTGGVSLSTMQFARSFGARVIAVTSSDEKADRVMSLGAHHAINREATPAWEQEVLRLTGGQGADHVVEAIGPATLEKSLKAVAFGGQVVLVGVFGSQDTSFPASALSGRMITIRRVAVGPRAAFEAMNRAIEFHQLRPVIDRVFPFTEAHAAYRHFEARRHFGKVAIQIA